MKPQLSVLRLEGHLVSELPTTSLRTPLAVLSLNQKQYNLNNVYHQYVQEKNTKPVCQANEDSIYSEKNSPSFNKILSLSTDSSFVILNPVFLINFYFIICI